MIRKAKLTDLPKVLELEQTFSSNKLNMRAIKKFFKSSCANLLVEIEKESVVGYALLVRNKRSKLLHFDSFTVDPKYRSKGIGSRMLRQIIDKYGKEDIVLEVACKNSSVIRMYEKYGFLVEKFLPEHYSDKSDAHRMLRKGIKNK